MLLQYNINLTGVGQNIPQIVDANHPLPVLFGGSVIVTPSIGNIPSGAVSTQGVISSAMTAQVSTLLLAAPGAGVRNYISSITVSNSHATVGTELVLQDGFNGATIWIFPAAANFGGATHYFGQPLRQPTLNTGVFIANVVTGSSTKASGNGYSAT